ncbi:MAG: chemotaxis protein [Rhodospirillales bacterium]|nr:chemotaxis protein [Rhodospirillales bacterium]
MPSSRSRSYNSASYWPGFVDALAALLVVVVFLIMVFALAQAFLSDAISGRDTVLEKLNAELEELGQMLSLERNTNAKLQLSVAQLTSELGSSISERDLLKIRLSSIEKELATEKSKYNEQILDLNKIIKSDKESIELQLRDLERLNRDILALKEVRKNLENKVSVLIGTLESTEGELGKVRDLSKELKAKIADESERTLLVQEKLNKRDIRLKELLQSTKTAEESLLEEKKLSKNYQNKVSLIGEQLKQLRIQLAALNQALEATESKNKEQKTQIVNLGKRLNAALATRVQELARYRSEFFGRLRQTLGNRSDIRIEGDRFVFQSEVLFESGAADLNRVGSQQLSLLGTTLRKISKEIPKDLDWVLRVDGHTDERPISTTQFPSNWELSSARSTSVVKFLINQGISPNRLVAAGFGQYQPIDIGSDEIAYRRNRRIEFKLTQR